MDLSNRKTIATSTLIVVVVGAAIVIGLTLTHVSKTNVNSNQTYNGPGGVLVPNVIGMTAQEASSNLQRSGLYMSPTLETWTMTEQRARGVVTSEDPAAGSRVRSGSIIALKLKTGTGQQGAS